MVTKIIEKAIQFWAFNIKKNNVVAILNNGIIPHKIVYGKNLVTNDGDTYYAQSGAAESPDNAYVGVRLGTGTTPADKADTDVETEASAGRHTTDGTYPKTDDQDSDNSGAGVDIVTWRTSYTLAEGNIVDIAEGAIVDSLTTPISALCHWIFAVAFTKTSNDTLKVFVNHTFNGV